jgi:pantoate--beta-alanine ligase
MTPELITTAGEMARSAAALVSRGEACAFVPTMGALHDGHLALVTEAARRRPVTVVSVFVNPTQFGPHEDYLRYPRDLARDARLAGEAGASLVFAPTVEELYPAGFQSFVQVEELSRHLCGPHRPGHFRGVATVVLKLFNLVRPSLAVFGQKDWQQLQVVRRLVRDLDLPVEIVGHPIVREADGLAMSSRNAYLSPQERTRALALPRALRRGSELVRRGERTAAPILEAMVRVLAEARPEKVDYVAVADPETLEPLERISGRALLALAAWVGGTRLIDNVVTETDG